MWNRGLIPYSFDCKDYMVIHPPQTPVVPIGKGVRGEKEENCSSNCREDWWLDRIQLLVLRWHTFLSGRKKKSIGKVIDKFEEEKKLTGANRCTIPINTNHSSFNLFLIYYSHFPTSKLDFGQFTMEGTPRAFALICVIQPPEIQWGQVTHLLLPAY